MDRAMEGGAASRPTRQALFLLSAAISIACSPACTVARSVSHTAVVAQEFGWVASTGSYGTVVRGSRIRVESESVAAEDAHEHEPFRMTSPAGGVRGPLSDHVELGLNAGFLALVPYAKFAPTRRDSSFSTALVVELEVGYQQVAAVATLPFTARPIGSRMDFTLAATASVALASIADVDSDSIVAVGRYDWYAGGYFAFGVRVSDDVVLRATVRLYRSEFDEPGALSEAATSILFGLQFDSKL